MNLEVKTLTLARTRALAPAILAAHPESFPGGVCRPTVASALLSSTGIAVITVRPAGEPPCAVIKLPTIPTAVEGLDRETATLAALHGNERLGPWRERLPRPRAHGTLNGQRYRIDSALSGRQVLEPLVRSEVRARALSAAADAIGVLHQATVSKRPARVELAERWVDEPLTELDRRAVRRRSIAAGLRRLHDELHEAVARRAFSTCWIHGDYWLGNLLFSDPAMPNAAPGIVDWDAAAPLELSLHDVLHLLLYTRRLLTGRELGHLVRDQLIGSRWLPEERELLDRHAAWRPAALSDRHALLLYWLRHVAMNARQQPRSVGYRYRLWERRNVLPVLASL